jgi:putative ATP-binding cassette transporter
MTFIRLLLDEMGPARVWVILATVTAGLSMGSILAVINSVVDNGSANASVTMIGLFVLACCGFIFGKGYALNLVTFVNESLVDRWRVRIADKLRDIDLAAFQHIGRERIALVLTRETQALADASISLVHSATTSVMLFVTSLYVAYVSLIAFIAIVVTFLTTVQFYRLTQVRTRYFIDQSVKADNAFSESFHHLLDGFREVKLSRTRSDDLFKNYLEVRSRLSSVNKIDVGRRQTLGMNVTNATFFSLVGFIVFVLPQIVDSTQTSAKLINIILFCTGAVELLLRGLPMIARANVSIEALQGLEREVQDARSDDNQAYGPLVPKFNRIEAHDVIYSYAAPAGTRPFVVGPVTFSISAGEVVFIVGGNGSGKSTLLNLLTQLYKPKHGMILWDGVPVDKINTHEYRHLFATIFSDFHLFDRLYGQFDIDETAVQDLIEEVKMSDKVRFSDSRFSTLDLSSGQRKRLAMVVARSEGRPIMVFDEWAADQDPHFRRFFYDILIPSLRASGKTIIAVTHDDRFFSAADRVLVMEEGKLHELEHV